MVERETYRISEMKKIAALWCWAEVLMDFGTSFDVGSLEIRSLFKISFLEILKVS